MSAEQVVSNSALYKRLSKPFKSLDAFGDATELLFRALAVVREACGLPEVIVIAAAQVGAQKSGEGPSLAMRMASHGDPRCVLPMLRSALASSGDPLGTLTDEERAAVAEMRMAKLRAEMGKPGADAEVAP